MKKSELEETVLQILIESIQTHSPEGGYRLPVLGKRDAAKKVVHLIELERLKSRREMALKFKQTVFNTGIFIEDIVNEINQKIKELKNK